MSYAELMLCLVLIACDLRGCHQHLFKQNKHALHREGGIAAHCTTGIYASYY